MLWVLAVVVLLLWYFIVRYYLKPSSSAYYFSTLSQLCPSPDCLRCSTTLKTLYCSDVAGKLKKMYVKYESLAVHKMEERLTFNVSTLPASRRPTVCYLRNMCDDAWHNHKQMYLQDTLTDAYSGIKAELASSVSNRELWCVSETGKSGAWQKLFLYNQGKKIENNCKEMPKTTQLIEGLDTFMKGVIFGNAFISILDQQSVVEPHCGPTNLRVRCHMGLQIPVGNCSITVNGVEEKWSNQECLLFDDSFVHSATNMTESQRIVLIVDLWHPNLTLTEMKILRELFAVRDIKQDNTS